MPTYQYACTECDHAFEQVQRFTDNALTECPACQGRLRKIFNAVGVVFKGSGFYRTDSRNENGSRSTDSSSTSGVSSSTGSSDSPGSTGAATGSSDSPGSTGAATGSSTSSTSSSSSTDSTSAA